MRGIAGPRLRAAGCVDDSLLPVTLVDLLEVHSNMGSERTGRRLEPSRLGELVAGFSALRVVVVGIFAAHLAQHAAILGIHFDDLPV